MALILVFHLLLWGLTLFSHGVTPFCNVTCSTDYLSSLNCSCSGSLPTNSIRIDVECREEDLRVNDTCEVKPPQSWCVMYPESFEYVTTVGTICTATVSQLGDQVIMSTNESSSWILNDVVKPVPPFDVQVTNTDGFYNITWDHDRQDCLKYTVRMRDSKDLKNPVHSLSAKEKHILLDNKRLQPGVSYIVDVQAKFCPGSMYDGPWSEWSSTAELKTKGTIMDGEGINIGWWYSPLSIIPIVLLLLLWLVYSKKTYWQKKVQHFFFIPNPNEFFKPLHQNYGGNFKEWVKPAFSEYDYLRISSQVQMTIEKQHDVLQWNNEKQSYQGDNKMNQGGHFLNVLQPHGNSLPFSHDGGSSQGTSHSTGHISIHTVTLSGEEEFEEEVVSQSSVNSLPSYQDGQSFSSFGEDNREQAGYDGEEPQMARLDRQSGVLAHHENQISNDFSVENINFQPHVQLNEPERVSLDSFASNEQSEDGYPHVDLDTIDSGFGECGSPGASDSNIAEQIDSQLFHEHKSSNSNYVKQWMVCSTIQEDPSTSESELHETQ